MAPMHEEPSKGRPMETRDTVEVARSGDLPMTPSTARLRLICDTCASIQPRARARGPRFLGCSRAYRQYTESRPGMGASKENYVLFKKETAPVTKERVLDALRQIIDPDFHKDIVSLGMIKQLEIRQSDSGAAVSFTFELTTPACPVRDKFKSSAEEVVSSIPGVTSVNVTMSANVRSSAPTSQQGQISLPNVKN